MTPPDVRRADPDVLAGGLRLGWRYRRLGTAAARQVTRVLPQSVADFLEDRLASDALRAAVATRAIRHTAMGPRMAGTTAVLLTDSAGNAGGAAGETVYARGGPGALAEALAGALAAGVTVRTGARVTAVRDRGGSATGVALADGEEIRAAGRRQRPATPHDAGRSRRSGVPGAGAGRGGRPPARPRRDRQGQPGPRRSARLPRPGRRGRCAPAARPHRRGAVDGLPRSSGRRGQVRAHQRGPLAGGDHPQPRRPAARRRCPGGRRAARHERPRCSRRRTGCARATGTASARPSATSSCAPWRRSRPASAGWSWRARCSRRWTWSASYGLAGGHPLHLEPGLDQWFAWRPLWGYARYRMPLAGLYLCGAGAHPGGGVTGLPAGQRRGRSWPTGVRRRDRDRIGQSTGRRAGG